MKRKITNFIIVLVIQFLILTSIVFYYKSKSKGTTVFLQIGPRDPMTPLRGDYLEFIYRDISSISEENFEEPVEVGDIVYVPLIKIGKFWKIREDLKISRRKKYDGVYIKGIVSYSNGDIRITYGIENYYIPIGRGRDIKWSNNDYAEVIIDNEGNPMLKKIYLNGQPFP